MVPQSFFSFFAASAGAGAALIGLLFVAISISPERTIISEAPIARQAVAASTFTALVNAFFISFYALIPGGNLGVPTILMATLALVSGLPLTWRLLRDHVGWFSTLRRSVLIIISLVLFGFELRIGINLLNDPKDLQNVISLAALLGGVYAYGLTRAWQLLGAKNGGVLSWFNILQEAEEEERKRTSAVGDKVRQK